MLNPVSPIQGTEDGDFTEGIYNLEEISTERIKKSLSFNWYKMKVQII